MNNRTDKTENHTVICLEKNENTEIHLEENSLMDFETGIVLFTIYAGLPEDEDHTWVMEFGMYLIEKALTTPDRAERLLIAGIVLEVAYVLDIEVLLQEACKLLPETGGTASQICARMGTVSNNLDEHLDMISNLLRLLGIDNKKKRKALDKIFIIFGLEG